MHVKDIKVTGTQILYITLYIPEGVESSEKNASLIRDRKWTWYFRLLSHLQVRFLVSDSPSGFR